MAATICLRENGELFESKTVFDSEEQILIVMDRILSPLGRRLDRVSPIVDARLEMETVSMQCKPCCSERHSVTIRRFTGKITSLDRLVEMKSLPQWLARFLSWAVKCRQGNRGCWRNGIRQDYAFKCTFM